jgi:hypothetical protein
MGFKKKRAENWQDFYWRLAERLLAPALGTLLSVLILHWLQ